MVYSEYYHCIPRLKYLFNECTELIPSWINLKKLTNGQKIKIRECLHELILLLDLIADTLIRDELIMCLSSRSWIKVKRQKLKIPSPNLNFIESCNVMIIDKAIKDNLYNHKIPTTIPRQATLLQYLLETEMDRWLNKMLYLSQFKGQEQLESISVGYCSIIITLDY